MNAAINTPVGIDDLSVYVPNLYLSIKDLAEERGIEPAKLEKGLGLVEMAVPDSSEDVVTMAAEALIDLVQKNNIKPEEIRRIYVGTESMVDSSKPISSYLLGILGQYFGEEASHSLIHCDVVDMTFACIGAVDAMLNCLDWVRLNPNQKAIVIATDLAKYDLDSTGEYTQGAGALAMLLAANPRIMQIDAQIGISTKCVHDFYKPLRRKVNTLDQISSNGIDARYLGREVIVEHKETPIYDGQFSNQCYSERITEALTDFRSKSGFIEQVPDWSKMIFHLPYAYQARRMFVHIYIDELVKNNSLKSFLEEENMSYDEDNMLCKETIRAISKSAPYKSFIKDKMYSGDAASSRVGNLYTGSIFLSLLSCLSLDEVSELENKKIGFFAYGSGSKSKVFQGTVVPGFKKYAERCGLFEKIDRRNSITFQQYEYLHRGKLLINLDSSYRSVFHGSSGFTDTNRFARDYVYQRMA